jgi:threonine aldolase
MIDLRSDTVTLPTPEMRNAMANAQVGDDVYQEDPTVNRLEEISAELMGKQAGLFLTSGTMGNLTAILVNCKRGDEVLMGDMSHTFLFEVGGFSALGGVMAHTLPNLRDGTLAADQILDAIRGSDIHEPNTRMVVLENTHNCCGGVAISKDYMDQVGEIAHSHGLLLHIDGARIFNAAIKFDMPARALVQAADSVTFCLSKGLGAPVGSVLCGTRDFIQQARKVRKQLGGGMRQAGIIAAGGIYALTHHIERLREDHERAGRLAKGLSALKGIKLAPGSPHTNMIFLNLDGCGQADMQQVVARFKSKGIAVGISGKSGLRLVVHLGITDEDIQKTILEFASFSNEFFC